MRRAALERTIAGPDADVVDVGLRLDGCVGGACVCVPEEGHRGHTEAFMRLPVKRH